jgi:hypothetical protein
MTVFSYGVSSVCSSSHLNFHFAVQGGRFGVISLCGSRVITSSTNSRIAARRWTHIAVTYQAGTITHYNNGVDVGTTVVQLDTYAVNYFNIGFGFDVNGFIGLISDVRHYNRALSGVRKMTFSLYLNPLLKPFRKKLYWI